MTTALMNLVPFQQALERAAVDVLDATTACESTSNSESPTTPAGATPCSAMTASTPGRCSRRRSP